MLRNIHELSNQTFSDVQSDYFVARKILGYMTSGQILVEDPMTRELLTSGQNQYGFEKLFELLARLGMFHAGNMGEIIYCLENKDSLAKRNHSPCDTVKGAEVKTSKSIRKHTNPKTGKFSYYFRISGLEKKDRSKVAVGINYGGMRQTAILDLTGHTGKHLNIPCNAHGVIKKNTKWGQFFEMKSIAA